MLYLVVAAFPAAAQGILPSTFSGWTAAAPSTLIPPTALDPFVGPDAPAFREYIVKSVEQRAYAQGVQTASVTLTAFGTRAPLMAATLFCATTHLLTRI
jgi:hypothetical protein